MLYPDFAELIHTGDPRKRIGAVARSRTLAAASGSYTSPFRGQGLSFEEVRDYRPGDDVRAIDWRVTARLNKPHLKVFTEDRERSVMLCVDAHAGMRWGTRGTFKSVQAARAAAYLGRLANGSHDRVGALIYGDVPDGLQSFRPSRTRRALWRALQLLSEKATDRHAAEVPLGDALRHLARLAPAGSLLFIVSDFQRGADALDHALPALQRRGDVVLVAIDDPADLVLPDIGRAAFAADGTQALLDTGDARARAAYAREWQDTRDHVRAICVKRGVGLIDLRTDRDVVGDLDAGLRRLAKGGRG